MSLIDEEPRSAHVIAMEDSNLLVIRREDFQSILQQSPGIAMGLLRELSRRLRRVDEKVGSLVLLDVNGRVAQLLLDLADEAGSDRKSTRLNSNHSQISYAVFCLKKKKIQFRSHKKRTRMNSSQNYISAHAFCMKIYTIVCVPDISLCILTACQLVISSLQPCLCA